MHTRFIQVGTHLYQRYDYEVLESLSWTRLAGWQLVCLLPARDVVTDLFSLAGGLTGLTHHMLKHTPSCQRVNLSLLTKEKPVFFAYPI